MTAVPALSFHASGSQNGATIVFLHGGGGGWWMWRAAAAHLPEYHCLMPDLPEHGESRAVEPFSMPLAAEKVADLIRAQARGGKAVVVGLSEGAQVTVQLLADAPDLVERAIVSSALLLPMPGMAGLTRGMVAWSYRLFVTPFKNFDGCIRLNMKYAAGVPGQYYPEFKKEFQEGTESGFTNLLMANQTFRLPAGLEKVNVPTLVVVGKKEYRVMKQSAHELAAVLPDAKAFEVDLGKAGSLASEHNWAMTAPELFAQTTRAWVEGGPLPAQLTPFAGSEREHPHR